MPCRYADVLGSPGTGFHRMRLGGVAAGDFLLTLAVALGLSYIHGSPPLVIWLVLLLLLAIVVHGSMCTKTSVNEWLYANSARTLSSAVFLVATAVAIVALRARN